MENYKQSQWTLFMKMKEICSLMRENNQINREGIKIEIDRSAKKRSNLYLYTYVEHGRQQARC